MSPARVLCIGGVDPTGGAGLVRDAWAISRFAPELSAAFIVSAWTWQGRGQPARARALAPARFEALLARVDDGTLHLKLGLLPESLVPALRAFIALRQPASVVVDPVLRASDGGDLGADPEALRGLAGPSTLFTPNRDEAQRLGWEASRPGPACLFKLAGQDEGQVVDELCVEGSRASFSRTRVPGTDPRGTGCTLATAIACGRARGRSWEQAVSAAITFLDAARSRLHRGPDGRPHLR